MKREIEIQFTPWAQPSLGTVRPSIKIGGTVEAEGATEEKVVEAITELNLPNEDVEGPDVRPGMIAAVDEDGNIVAAFTATFDGIEGGDEDDRYEAFMCAVCSYLGIRRVS